MKLIFLILFIFSACVKQSGPEKVLSDFLHYRLEQNQSKEQVLSFLTGKMHERFSALSDEDFKKGVESKNLKLKSFDIVQNLYKSDSNCSITYIVSYEDSNGSLVKASVKKLAEFIKVENDWKISEITNLKTFYDMKEPIDVNISK